jgi:MFS transporter, OFA family, oxalate/formate antiporter
VIAQMIDGWGWRAALWIMALAVGAVFTVICLFWVRDTPESCGLLPDGVDAAEHARNPPPPASPNLTLQQARRSPVFWIYSAALSMHALFGTAVTFHIVSIFEAAGRSRVEAFGYFLPQAIVSLTVNLIASLLADRMSLKPLLVLMLVAFVLGGWGLLTLDSFGGYALLVLGFGMGGGLWGVLSNLGFVRNFGRLHLGEITGLSTALTVLASATGPLLFSLGVDWFGGFDSAVSVCIALNLALLAGAVVIRHREPERRVR